MESNMSHTAQPTAKKTTPSKTDKDLRQLLLTLYLKNNPKFEHKVFIYSYRGVSNDSANPFHYVSGDLDRSIKKSLIIQNLPSGEMIQAFFVPAKAPNVGYALENTIVYGNQSGVLIDIPLSNHQIDQSEKYRQFTALVEAILRQFV